MTNKIQMKLYAGFMDSLPFIDKCTNLKFLELMIMIDKVELEEKV